MPHRALTYVPRCVLCEERTKKTCKRCGLPLCKPHLPPRDRRCDACEADYALRERSLPVKGGEASITAVPHGFFLSGLVTSIVAGVVGIMALAAELPLSGLWVVLAILGILGVLLVAPAWVVSTIAAGSAQLAGAGYAHLVHKRARQKFLRERKVDETKRLEGRAVDAGAGGSD